MARIGYTLRKGGESVEGHVLDWNIQGARRSKLGKRLFWRKQENVAKHGASLDVGGELSEMKMLHKCPVFLMERKKV
jgi:hypothetical protein